jgi:hypothetical protein
MRDFFLKIFGKKEPETLIIAYASVPALLDEREQSARSALKDQTSQPVQEIRNGIARLQLIVSTIAGAEHEPEIHPKLKSIAKNTLPQFIRAMNTALSRELPADDIEAFYPAIVECVKNCLNSINGPGRYLRIVFPDEMKASRAGVDAIGHEINTITAALASYRKEITAITRTRELFGTIQGNTQAITMATEKEMRARQRITDIAGRLDEISGELAELPSDPGIGRCREEERPSPHLANPARGTQPHLYRANDDNGACPAKGREDCNKKEGRTGDCSLKRGHVAVVGSRIARKQQAQFCPCCRVPRCRTDD